MTRLGTSAPMKPTDKEANGHRRNHEEDNSEFQFHELGLAANYLITRNEFLLC